MPRISVMARELRAEFQTASILPVLVATALVRFETGGWDPLLFALTLAGVVFIHLGTNIANDYFDHISGADEANVDYVRPFTGGSRLIQEGLITPRAVLSMSVFFLALGAAVAAVLYVIKGPMILYLGLAGTLLGFFYTAPPVKLASRGLGELAVCLGFGLIGPGTYFVQTSSLSPHIIVASLPLALLTAAIIIINEFQDCASDGATGKRTIVVRLGRRRSVAFYAAVVIAAYVPIAAGAAFSLMPKLTLIGLASLPIAFRGIAAAASRHDDPAALVPANVATIASHLATGLLLTAAYIFA